MNYPTPRSSVLDCVFSLIRCLYEQMVFDQLLWNCANVHDF